MRNGEWRTMCMAYVKAFQSASEAVLTYIFLLAAVLNFSPMYGQKVLSVSLFAISVTVADGHGRNACTYMLYSSNKEGTTGVGFLLGLYRIILFFVFISCYIHFLTIFFYFPKQRRHDWSVSLTYLV